MKVYDCFLFFNELKLLKVRLHELYPVVDKFILLESTRTFLGLQKPLWFKENKEAFKPYLDKVIHVVVDDDIAPVDGQVAPFSREGFQRNALVRGMGDCVDGDIIMLSDLDEIPKREVVAELVPTCTLEQTLYYYFLNMETSVNNSPVWLGTGVFKYPLAYDLEHLRYHQGDLPHVSNAGWHFSYFGTAEQIKQKIQAYSHQEYNNSNVINSIQSSMNATLDLCQRRGIHLKKVPFIPENYPHYVQEHPEEFVDNITRL